jgi:hypothetical protein
MFNVSISFQKLGSRVRWVRSFELGLPSLNFRIFESAQRNSSEQLWLTTQGSKESARWAAGRRKATLVRKLEQAAALSF